MRKLVLVLVIGFVAFRLMQRRDHTAPDEAKRLNSLNFPLPYREVFSEDSADEIDRWLDKLTGGDDEPEEA